MLMPTRTTLMPTRTAGTAVLRPLLVALIWCAGTSVASADQAGASPRDSLPPAHEEQADVIYRIPNVLEASRVNDDTVGVVFSDDDLFGAAVRNLDAEITAHDGPRLVLILGKNSVQSVYDLLYLNNVDIALTRSDAIEYVKRIGNFPAVTNVVQNILDVRREKILILTGPDVESVADLDGTKVSMGHYASGAYITGTVIADILGIDVEPVFSAPEEGLGQLRSGEVSAFVYLLQGDVHEESPGLEMIRGIGDGDGVQVLALPPDNEELKGVYTTTSLGSGDLPGLLAGDTSVPTYEVHTVLVAYRWRADNPRYEKSVRFVNSAIDVVDHLKDGPVREFWGDLSVDTEAPGIERLAVVEEVLEQQERRRLAEEQAARERLEAQREAERLLLERLREQEEALADLLRQRAGEVDSEEFEQLVDEVDQFVDRLEIEVKNSTASE